MNVADEQRIVKILNNWEIPWNKIAGLRHRLVHNYEGTNWNIIVEVIYEDCPKFIEDIKKIISENKTC